MILLADSGSTKTDWCVCRGEEILQRIQTQGINPYHQTTPCIRQVLEEELKPVLRSEYVITRVLFYGAGCANEAACERVREALAQVLEVQDIQIHSDLLGAARALCGHHEGIACVLGTGSNS